MVRILESSGRVNGDFLRFWWDMKSLAREIQCFLGMSRHWAGVFAGEVAIAGRQVVVVLLIYWGSADFAGWVGAGGIKGEVEVLRGAIFAGEGVVGLEKFEVRGSECGMCMLTDRVGIERRGGGAEGVRPEFCEIQQVSLLWRNSWKSVCSVRRRR